MSRWQPLTCLEGKCLLREDFVSTAQGQDLWCIFLRNCRYLSPPPPLCAVRNMIETWLHSFIVSLDQIITEYCAAVITYFLGFFLSRQKIKIDQWFSSTISNHVYIQSWCVWDPSLLTLPGRTESVSSALGNSLFQSCLEITVLHISPVWQNVKGPSRWECHLTSLSSPHL